MNDIEQLRKIDRVHPYPAKYTVDLAIEYIEKYSKPKDTVYDPFLGSGTTLLAASVLDRNGIGTDINHIALLISRFKTMNLTNADFIELEKFISDFENNYPSEVTEVKPVYYKSIEHWFCKESIIVLSLIKQKISKLTETQQLFCDTVMSTIINSVSNQESDTRYAAIEKPYLSIEYVANTFIKKFKNILSLYKDFSKVPRNPNNTAYLLDAKLCTSIIEPKSVDLILTSPPYVNTYDYYLYHKHRMNWLGYDVQYSMNAEIGSRREYSSLKKPESKFSDDLFNVFIECDKVLKDNGIVVIIIGDGKVAGKMYDAKENMIEIAEKIGWEIIDYSYSNLDDTSRAFQKSYRTKGKKEHILVFRKKV